MGEIPHEKALVERLKNEPFVLLGVNTDDDKDEYRAKLVDHGVTWRSSWQGSTGGPWPTQWGVNAYPTIFILDEDHVIRAMDARGEDLGKVVDDLLAKRKAKQAAGK
ncbi:MAG: hypothetical protein ABL998_09345 [Planctomycetota bacterium]